jgi:FkbM family methyltransferase
MGRPSIRPSFQMSHQSQPIEAARFLESARENLDRTTPGNPAVLGWHSYSQCDEDGIIRECLRRIGMDTPLSRTFIEIGCGDGLENNTHQLALDGFCGCWIDGDPGKIQSIETELGTLQSPTLMVRHAFAKLDSIVDVIRDCRAFLGTGDVDFFSFDIDGNDTHLVRASLTVIGPKLICVEYNAKFPPPSRLEMPYSPDHRWSGDDYFGASLQTWTDLLVGYVLVSCNLSGANAFFVRKDLAARFARHPVEALYQPARYWLVGCRAGHRPSLRWLRDVVQRAHPGSRPWLVEAKVPQLPPFEFEIHRRADRYISGDLARDKIWEPFETEVFRRICRQGDFVVDIGANIGWYAAVASALIGNEGRLVCFEPDPANHALLARNIARCRNAPATQLREEAVGDSAGKTKLFLSETNLGDHRIFDDGSPRLSIEVPIVTLDSIFSGEARLPDIVKSDTQGSEAKILAGASGLFARGWRPVMLLEFWPFGLTGSGNQPLALWDTLGRLGYSMYEVSEAKPRLTRLTADIVRARVQGDIAAASGNFINLLAMPAGSDRGTQIADLIA